MIQHHYEELTYIKSKLKDYVEFYGTTKPDLLKEISSLVAPRLDEKRCHECWETLEKDGTWYCGQCYYEVKRPEGEEVVDYADSLC